MRPTRRLALTVAALGLTLAAAGCSYFNPTQTHEFYQAADGTNANLSVDGHYTVGVRNAIVIVPESGEAHLIGAVANYTDDEVDVSLEGTTADGTAVFATRVAVPAQQTVTLGSGEGAQQVAIGELPTAPGEFLTLSVSDGSQSTEISLPVTTAGLEYYDDLGGGSAEEGAQG